MNNLLPAGRAVIHPSTLLAFWTIKSALTGAAHVPPSQIPGELFRQLLPLLQGAQMRALTSELLLGMSVPSWLQPRSQIIHSGLTQIQT